MTSGQGSTSRLRRRTTSPSGGSILSTRAPMKPSCSPAVGPVVDLPEIEDEHAVERAADGHGCFLLI